MTCPECAPLSSVGAHHVEAHEGSLDRVDKEGPAPKLPQPARTFGKNTTDRAVLRVGSRCWTCGKNASSRDWAS